MGTYDLGPVLLGAIVGIASALITQGIIKTVGIRYSRQARNWNALVKLEQSFNTNLQMNHENITLLEQALGEMEKGKLPVFHLRTWEIDTDVLLEIVNIDLINDVFSLNIDLKRMNHFAGVTSSLFSEVRKHRLSGQITDEEVGTAISSLKKDVENMREYAKFLDGEIQTILAKVRMLCKSKGFMRSVLKFFTKNEYYPTDSAKRLEKELVLIKDDIKKVAEQKKQKVSTIGLKE